MKFWSSDFVERRPLLIWSIIGALLFVLTLLLVLHAPRFGYELNGVEIKLADIPALPLAFGMVVAGLLFLGLPSLIAQQERLPVPQARTLLMLMISVGVALRVAMFWSEPALEDDYQRYMWDGAIVANGINPYEASPAQAQKADPFSQLGFLAKSSGKIIERINHAELRTIYPPVTQAAFGLAHLIAPWKLNGWRAVCFAGEIATLFLLLSLLSASGRAPLWAALYWWNPVVIKEMLNSAHMEAILLPLVLAAFWAASRRKYISASVWLSLGIGAKIWPIILTPIVLRGALAKPWIAAACVAIIGCLTALWFAPIYAAGIDNNSGFVAYASRWKTVNALLPQIELGVGAILNALSLTFNDTARVTALLARALFAGLLGLIILWLARRPIDTTLDLMQRGALVTAALYLLSPAQFPWYVTWMMPFLCFLPIIGLLALTATIPLYYTAFYFFGLDQFDTFKTYMVWVIWIPIWTLLITEAWQWRRNRRALTSPTIASVADA